MKVELNRGHAPLIANQLFVRYHTGFCLLQINFERLFDINYSAISC